MRTLPFFKPKKGVQFAGEGVVDSSGGGGGGYTLPTATASRLGGVKIGTGINVAEDGTISFGGARGKWYTGAVVGTKSFAQLAQEIVQAGVDISLTLPSLMDQFITDNTTVSSGVNTYLCNFVGRNVTVLVTTWNGASNVSNLFSLVDFFEFGGSYDDKGIPIIVKYYGPSDSRNGIYVF